MEDEYNYVKGSMIDVNKIEIELKPNLDKEIDKIIMYTDEGEITYKPKVKHEEMIDGFIVSTPVAAKITQIPAMIRAINQDIHKFGICKCKAYYRIWKTTKDNGESVKYQFIQGDKMLDKWQITKHDNASVEYNDTLKQ